MIVRRKGKGRTSTPKNPTKLTPKFGRIQKKIRRDETESAEQEECEASVEKEVKTKAR